MDEEMKSDQEKSCEGACSNECTGECSMGDCGCCKEDHEDEITA